MARHSIGYLLIAPLEGEECMSGPAPGREILQCPFCGHRIERDEHPGAIYCGPHKLEGGNFEPARKMRRLGSELDIEENL